MEGDDKIVKWVVIENVVTILVLAALFAYTKSAWCFLLLLNINFFKTKK